MTSTVLADLPFMDAFATPSEAQWRAAVDKVLKGADFAAIASEVVWLFGFVVVFSILALVRFRRTLD